MKRINEYVETAKSLKERHEELANRELNSIKEAEDSRNEFVKKYHSIRENREARERMHGVLMEQARNNALSTAIKGIYIGALEAATLTDNAIFLAETMVDNWIKERGGASNILSERANDTYFLARLTQIVEDAAKEEVKEIEKDEDAEEEKKEDKKEESEDKKDDKKEEEKSNDSEEEKKEDKSEDNKESKEDSKSNDEDKDSENDVLNYTGDDEDEDEESEEDDSDEEEDVVFDDEDDTSEEDNEDENNGKVFEDLDKEEDVQKAVELIRKRVADAEETFIKNNTEDKKKIDELLGKISDNVKTVEDMGDEDSKESQIAKESARINNRKIKDITENRQLTVFEKMTRELGSSIVRDVNIKEQYMDENGSLDSASVVETARVMYGFLETLNTLQLEKVDENYITKVLEEIE